MPEIYASLPNNELLVSRIAREVARNLVPIDMIQTRYRLSDDEYHDLINTPIFKARLEEELTIWNSSDALSMVERIKAKSCTVVEESLVEVYELIHDKNEPMASKIRALEWVSGLAGLNDTERLGSLPPGVVTGGGSGINFNIFIGDKKQTFNVTSDQPPVIEGEVVLTGST